MSPTDVDYRLGIRGGRNGRRSTKRARSYLVYKRSREEGDNKGKK